MGSAGHAGAFAPPETSPDGKTALIGLSREELEAVFAEKGLPRFRARQVFNWIYTKGATDFGAMSDIGKDLRPRLADWFSIPRPEIVTAQISEDGTRKWLFRMPDGQEIETVFIPEADRGTLCVSSQVGCTLTCRFCHTGTMPLVRNLSAAEILQQVMVARDQLSDWPSSGENRMLTNIVMMGMGEPLYNYDSVAKAIRLMMDGDGLSIGKRKITLSTSGVVPNIVRAGRELGVNLAISLHATNDELRTRIMPINRKYPLAELMEACRAYPTLSNARRITWEYVMLAGVNDSDADAHALVRLLDGIPSKINLIPFNPWPGSEYECSSNNRIRAFADILEAAGYATPIRKTRGQDILAACGQLKSESQRKRKSEQAA
jgi:23S rRNA (adenine2503-C2)-methyltransferase